MNNTRTSVSEIFPYIFLAFIISMLALAMAMNYQLFYFFSNISSEAYGIMLFVLYWNRLNKKDSVMLRFIGIGSLFIAFFDLIHLMIYHNIGFLYLNQTNAFSNLHLAARLMQSVTILLAVSAKKTVKPVILLFIYSMVTMVLLVYIFFSRALVPAAAIDMDYPAVKKILEWCIIIILLCSLYFHGKNRTDTDAGIFMYLGIAIIISVLAESLFFFNFSNDEYVIGAGLILRVIIFFFLFRTIIRSTLLIPQELLAQELTMYFKAVEASSLAITITDDNGNIEYSNPKFSAVTGYGREEVKGRNMSIISSGKQDNAFYSDLWTTILSGREWTGTFCNKKKNGDLFWERASISSIRDDEGSILQFIGLKEDITEERERANREKERLGKQLRYRTSLLHLSQIPFKSVKNSLEKITEAIASILDVHRVSVWKFENNKKQLVCLDLYTGSTHSSGETLETSSIPLYFNAIIAGNIIIAEDADRNAVFSELIANGFIPGDNTSIVDVPLFIAGNIFGVLSIQVSGKTRKWSPDEQNFITGTGSILSTMFETFGRRETEKKLVSALEDAKKANRVKSDFLANMSHEIRTPMNAILGFSEILLGRIENEEEHDFIESIHSSGKHLLSLINDILDLSKIEAGKIDILHGPFDIKSLVSNLDSMFRQKTERKGLEFDVKLPHGMPENLFLDGDRLYQVLINLVGNAVKFTDSGSIRISFSFSFPDRNKGTVFITIEIDDTGIGIPESDWQRVFNPFDQTGEGSKAQYGGTGLGLAISKKIIDLMGGEIRIVKKDSPGTLFRITLNKVKVDMANTIFESEYPEGGND